MVHAYMNIGLLALLATATNIDASPVRERDGGSSSNSTQCSSLAQSAPQHLSNLTVNFVNYVPAGSTINETSVAPYIAVGVDVGPFCRFSANITTSNRTSVRFEVWLPDEDAWNGNHLMVGNGGDSGSIYYADMQVPLGKYGFAVGGSNAGHDGDSGDGTFALNGPQAQYDFGYNAIHLSTVYTKEIINLYYGKKAKLSYWDGCSSGGKQGLKEIQMFPEDYDAALVGAPAWDWVHLNAWTYYVNAIVNNPNGTNYIAPPYWAGIFEEVLAQCDDLDGVKDGYITRPGDCFLDYSKFGCDGNSTVLNSTTCLQSGQIETLKLVHTNWTDPSTGELIFPAFNIGGEQSYPGTISGSPYGPAPSFFLYQVLNVTEVVYPIDFPALLVNGSYPTEAQLIELTKIGQATNPGMTRAGDPDLSPFFKRGGKLLHYVGGADPLIPTNTSHVYYESVRAKLGDVSNSYRFYEVPGMGHCSGGDGASNFGQASQGVTATGGEDQSVQFDAKHDALLALRAWRENGTRPDEIIAAKYVDNDIRNGVEFTRPICPWPQFPKYQGGNMTEASSFVCAE